MSIRGGMCPPHIRSVYAAVLLVLCLAGILWTREDHLTRTVPSHLLDGNTPNEERLQLWTMDFSQSVKQLESDLKKMQLSTKNKAVGGLSRSNNAPNKKTKRKGARTPSKTANAISSTAAPTKSASAIAGVSSPTSKVAPNKVNPRSKWMKSKPMKLVATLCTGSPPGMTTFQADIGRPATVRVFDVHLHNATTFAFTVFVEDAQTKHADYIGSMSKFDPHNDFQVEASISQGDWSRCYAVMKRCGSFRPVLTLVCNVRQHLARGHYNITLRSGEEGACMVAACVSEKPKWVQERDRTHSGTAVCVRPFSPFIWGTNTTSAQPWQIREWVKHHIGIGFDKIYLFDRSIEAPSLASYLETLSAEQKRVVKIRQLPLFLGKKDAVYTGGGTPSMIWDQIISLEMCFTQARRDGISYVFHMDFDEFLHPKKDETVLSSVQRSLLSCTLRQNGPRRSDLTALIVRRRAISGTRKDKALHEMTAKEINSLSGREKQNNVKSAFLLENVHMGVPVGHHVPCERNEKTTCTVNPQKLYISHLLDAFVERSSFFFPHKKHK